MVDKQDLQEKYRLTENQLKFWDDNGYYISPPLFTEEELADGMVHMARVFAEEYETNVPPNIRKWWVGDPETSMKNVDNAWWSDYVIRRFVLSPAIGAIATQLARTDSVRLFQDQMLDKPGIGSDSPRSATVGWHQDWAYWRCTTPAHALTARVSLDGETAENGCMQVVPSSHLWGVQDGRHFFQDDADINDLPEFSTPDGETVRVANLLLEPGGVSFHHSMTLHASPENRTNSPRRTIIAHMIPGETNYQSGTGDHAFNVSVLADQKESDLKDGDLWEGNRFPVIYPPSNPNGS